MTETYRSFGTASSLIFAYLGVAALIATGITAWILNRRPPAAVRVSRYRLVGLILFGVWLIVFGLFKLPQMLYGFGFLLFLSLNAFPISPEQPVKPILRIVTWVCVSLLAAVMILDGLHDVNRTITLTDDAMTFHSHFVRSGVKVADRSNLQADLTVSPSEPLIGPTFWTEWQFRSANATTQDGVSVEGNQWYLGPHGLVTGDQLARRITAWAGVSPTIHKEE